MTPKQREQLMEFCRLAAGWYVNNQNTNAHPWGGVANSADMGRFLYEYMPATGECRGNGVWGQGLAIMGLLPLAKRLDWAGEAYREAALAAGRYLMSLQILDQRDERIFGAFREATPQWEWIYPRDGATGAMGLCVLYRETKDEEYLYRARMYADWFMRAGMNKDRWPAYSFDFNKREGEWRTPGVWQVGSGLMFYYLYRLTGEKRYIDEGLTPLIEGYKRIRAKSEGLDELAQDDFGTIAAMGSYLLRSDAKLLGYIQQYASTTLKRQDADGSCPGLAGEEVNAITWQNFCRLAREKKLRVNLAPYEKGIAKTVAFIPTLQELDHRDRRAYGGLYGQTPFGVSRTSIHHRTVGYALIFMLRYEGGVLPAGYDVFEW